MSCQGHHVAVFHAPVFLRHSSGSLLPQHVEPSPIELHLGAVWTVAPCAKEERPVVMHFVCVVPHQLAAVLAARPASSRYEVLFALTGDGGVSALGKTYRFDEVEMRASMTAAYHPPSATRLRVATVRIEVAVSNLIMIQSRSVKV